jgi:hypothetical protein
MNTQRRDLRLHKLRYLLDQLDDNDLAIEISLQHLSGQILLDRRRAPASHYINDRRHPLPVHRNLLAIQATLASGLIFPILILFIR